MNIRDFYDDEFDFEVALSTAIKNAKTDWEIRFTNDLHDRYLKYGNKIILHTNVVRKISELQSEYQNRKP